MSNIRIKDLSTTAATTASDDFFGVDGATNGTRKLSAYSPTFGGNLTVSGTTSASSSILGAFLVGNGTAATNVAIGGGNINAGGTITAGGNATVGVTNANAALIVKSSVATGGAGYSELLLGNSSTNSRAYVSYNHATDLMVFGTSGGNKAYITGLGNFLVGTTDESTMTGAGGIKIGSTTSASSTTTGALQVAGGVGIAGAAYVGGNLTVSSTTDASSGAGALVVSAGGAYINKKLIVDDTIQSTKSFWTSGWQNLPNDSTSRAVLGVTGGTAYLQSLTGTTNNALSIDGSSIAFRTGTYTTALTLDSSQNATFAGNIKTAAPSGGTAGAWKLGVRVAATTTLDTTQYLQVDIGGTLYKVALVTS